jgi:hypothetical protein
MIKLIEVYRVKEIGTNNLYTVREVYVNPSHVVCMYDDSSMVKKLNEGYLPKDLDKRQAFTRLHLNQGQSVRQMTVIGNVGSTSEKLGLATNNRQLLRD